MKTSMLVLSLVLVGAGATAHASASRDAAVAAARASLDQYNREERQLAAATTIDPVRLVAHWKRLRAIRSQLSRIGAPATWSPGERVVLRHEVACLLGQSLVVDEARGALARSVATAAARRRIDLNAIARWSNRHLEFALDPSFALSLGDFGPPAPRRAMTASR